MSACRELLIAFAVYAISAGGVVAALFLLATW